MRAPLAATALLIATMLVVVTQPARALTRPRAYATVSCVSTTTCYAAGGTTVVATTDGGAHWGLRTTPASAFDLSAIACVTASRCELAGSTDADAGAVWGTTDGGASWRLQPAQLPGGFFLALDCASRAMCVATGNAGVITVTTDGGRTWNGQTVTGASLIYSVDCVSTLVCQAVGYSGAQGVTGIALRSVDGGMHWAVTPLPTALPSPNGVSCSDAQTCVAVGMDTTHAGSVQVGRVYRTTDSGGHWQPQAIPAGYTDLTSVSCPTASACIAGGFGPRAALSSGDGGVTWRAEGPTSAGFHGVDCVTGLVCVAVGETTSGHATIYATTDGGRSWQHQGLG